MGFQHLFAMFGATILVPILTGLSIQVTLIAVGIGTIIFHLVSKGKVPIFLGSSFSFLVGIRLITDWRNGIFATHFAAVFEGYDTSQQEVIDQITAYARAYALPYATGAILIAGLMYLVLALVIKIVGAERFMKVLPTVVTAPIVILIGVMLAPFAIDQASKNLPLALITLVIIIVFAVIGKGMTKIIPILLGIIGAYIIALVLHFAFGMTNADGSTLLVFDRAGTDLVGLPPFMRPRFNLVAIIIMLPFSLATISEHIADIVILKRISGNDYVKEPGLVRTLIGDGLATMFAGAIGGPATTTYSENVGVVTLTRIFDPRVVQLAAIYAAVLGFSPLFASFIYSIPEAIIGGASFILYGMIAAVGLRNLIDDRVDLADMKNCIIVAVILVTGLGLRFTMQDVSFIIAGTSVPLSRLGVAIAVIVGIILNLILPSAKDKDETPESIEE